LTISFFPAVGFDNVSADETTGHDVIVYNSNPNWAESFLFPNALKAFVQEIPSLTLLTPSNEGSISPAVTRMTRKNTEAAQER